MTVTCPMEAWRYECRRMSASERAIVRDAVQRYAAPTPHVCARAREAMLGMVTGVSELWVFSAHRDDRPVIGTYVLAQTGYSGKAAVPSGTGFRRAVLQWTQFALARVAIHEGAHLAGGDEAEAKAVEAHCVVDQYRTDDR
jgi:hypothetical protein